MVWFTSYNKCNQSGTNYGIGVELGHLAARILKKPKIEKYGLIDLAGEVGMDIKQPSGECPNWKAKLFLDEEIKYAVHNVYISYVIGN